MSGQPSPDIRPDAHDALNRFSFGSPQVHKLLAGLAADRARQEDADHITEDHVKAAARTLAADPRAAGPAMAEARLHPPEPRQGFARAAPRRRAVPAWLAEPVETYGVIVLAVGVVATAGWVAMGYNKTPSAPASIPAAPAILASPSTPQAPPSLASRTAPVVSPALTAAPLTPPAPVVASVPLPATQTLAPQTMAPQTSATELPATGVDDPALIPIPPRKFPTAPMTPRNLAPDLNTAPASHRHHLVHATPRGERDPLPPREPADNAAVAAASPPTPATLSAFQRMARRFPEPRDPAPADSSGPPAQRYIGSYVMGPNGTRQFVPDP